MTKPTRARMARLVAQWRESGESQASFARRHRIPGWTFWYGCKLSDEAPPIDSTARHRRSCRSAWPRIRVRPY